MNFNLQVRRSFPYLTTERFPHNWAIADMVKGYIAGTRKEHHRQAQEDQEGRDNSVTIKNTTHSTDASESEHSLHTKSSSGSGSKSNKRPRDHDIDETSDLEDDQLSQTSSKKAQSSSSCPKSNKRWAINSDIYAASELEDAPSQVNRQKIAHPSSGPKLKKHHSGDSNSNIYTMSEPEDVPRTKKRIQSSWPSMKVARSKNLQDVLTWWSTHHMRKESVLTPGEYEPLCNSHGNDDDDEHDDDDPENGNDYDQRHKNEFDGSDHNNFDDRNEDDDLNFECTPPMKMPSQRSCPSSQMKHIDDEDDWVGQGDCKQWGGDDSILDSA